MKHVRPLLRTRPLLGALVLLVLLQGLAAGVLGALGPSHVHRPGAAAPSEPIDWSLVERLAPRAGTAKPHAHAAFGLFHVDAAPARHHHPASDTSVVGLDPLLDSGLDDSGSALSLAFLLAVIPAVVGWRPNRTAATRPARPGWPALTFIADPPERPPRVA